ncbi:MAG: hypothetical protein AB8H79_11715 [Myxococcota bacterium]
MDNLIAGVAIARNGTRVTRNVRECARVPRWKLENGYDDPIQ